MKIKTKMDMLKAFAKLESICFTHLEALNDFADFDYKPIAVLEAELKATGKLDFGDTERENYDVFTEWLVDLMKDDEHWNIPNLSEGLAAHFPDWKDYLVFGMEEELAWEMVGKLTNAFPPFNEWLRTEFYPETVDMLESVKEFADQFEDCFCPLVEYIVNNDGDSLMEYARKLEKITRGISCGRPSMKYFWSNEYIECLDVLDIFTGEYEPLLGYECETETSPCPADGDNGGNANEGTTEPAAEENGTHNQDDAANQPETLGQPQSVWELVAELYKPNEKRAEDLFRFAILKGLIRVSDDQQHFEWEKTKLYRGKTVSTIYIAYFAVKVSELLEMRISDTPQRAPWGKFKRLFNRKSLQSSDNPREDEITRLIDRCFTAFTASQRDRKSLSPKSFL